MPACLGYETQNVLCVSVCRILHALMVWTYWTKIQPRHMTIIVKIQTTSLLNSAVTTDFLSCKQY